MERYAPPSVLLDQQFHVVQFNGQTGPYLEPSPGEPSFDILKLAREGLSHGLRTALQTARKTRKPVTQPGLRIRHGAASQEIDIEVIPSSGRAIRTTWSCSRRPRPGQGEDRGRTRREKKLPARSRISKLRKSSPPRANTCSRRFRKSKRQTKSCSRRTRKFCRATKSCRAPTKSSTPRRKSCSRPTKSSTR